VRLPRLSRVGRGVLAVALGAALSLVFPTVSAWWYAYVGLVPIIALVVAAPTRRAAGWLSVFAAFGFYVGLHHWLVPAIGPFTVPVAFALALLWLPFGLVAWSLLREPTGLRIAAAVALLPAIWLVVEFFRSWDRFGGSWGLLGLSQWQVHPVLAIAALGGVWLLSLLLVVVNVLLAAAALPGARAAHRAVCGGSAAAMVALAVIYGVSRPDPPVDRVVRIGGVQPGVVHSPEARLAANEELTRSLEDESVELVVWGQSSVGFDPELADDVRDRLVAAARGVGVDVLVNVDARGVDGRISKSTRLITPHGQADPVYDKQRLVPFGEYIPLRSVLGWVGDVTEAADEDRVRGDRLVIIETAGLRVGPLISYESTFPDLRRAVSRLDPDLVIVQGAATTFQGTWAQPQQASFEAVRAVESGRSSLLVMVSGTSAAFDARGKELAWIPADVEDAFVVEVPVGQEDTPYVRIGDWVVWLAAAIVVGFTARWLAQQLRSRHTAARSSDQATS
jgi:apolipoprotein N-acyltransferase